jgi:hypothetical protein
VISQGQRTPSAVREHHVTADYGYVRKDLVALSVVTALTLAFVVAMSFLV